MIGHCLSAAGSIESIAAVLQLHQGFIFPNINCEDLNPEITSIIDVSRIPQKLIETELNIIAKASFGFGDVNGCIIPKNIPKKIKYEQRRDFRTIKRYHKTLHQ
jgi:3-oxoacyl-(acyl-carrier-protein) synthase